MNTKKAYEEARKWEVLLDEAALAQERDGHKKPSTYILEKLLEEIALQIYKRDRDGNLEYDGNGRPKIDWISIVTGLARLIGKIIFLRKIYETALPSKD